MITTEQYFKANKEMIIFNTLSAAYSKNNDFKNELTKHILDRNDLSAYGIDETKLLFMLFDYTNKLKNNNKDINPMIKELKCFSDFFKESVFESQKNYIAFLKASLM